MPTITDKISMTEVRRDYIPRGCFYVVKNFEDWAFTGILEDHAPVSTEDRDTMLKLNENGYDVFWTANAIKEDKGPSSHLGDNLAWVNACYTDLDIPETENRAESKEKLAGEILFSDPQPSFVVETRAGYHLYWFTNTTPEKFDLIQQGIYEKWKHLYSDSAAKNRLRLLRVPSFYAHKKNESFKCRLRIELCNRYEDGSFKYHNSEDLLKAFPVQEQPVWAAPKQVIKRVPAPNSVVFKNTTDIFKYVKSLNQVEVFNRCNGTALTGGEIFTLSPERNGKIQIRSNGKQTPLWIDMNINALFSNNVKGTYSIIEFAQWYGLSIVTIAEELKQLYPNYKLCEK
jgi:hypothetical protein